MKSGNKRGIKALMQDVRSLFVSDPCNAIDNIASNMPGAITPPQAGEGAECDLSQHDTTDILRALGLDDEYEGMPLNQDEDDSACDIVAQLVQDTLRQRTDIYDAEYWRTFAAVYGSDGAEAVA